MKKRVLPPTFEIAAKRWLDTWEPTVAKNTQGIARLALKHLQPFFGAKLLCDIESGDIQDYQRSRLQAGVDGRIVNIEVGKLRQVLKANDMWTAFMGKVKMLRERHDIGKALTPDQEAALLAAAAKSDSACYTATMLALNTTMRAKKIRELRWEQVDFMKRELVVGESKTAASTNRLIPLNRAALKALAIGLDGFHCRFHDLRHSAITKLSEGQASDQTVMSIAGHVSQAMLKRYSHTRTEAKRAALDAISQAPEQPVFEDVVHQNVHQVDEGDSDAHRKPLN